jgi:hypothetical protein
MNPYLEKADVWEDFHLHFLSEASLGLAQQAGTRYVIKAETRLVLHELSAEERRFVGRADTGISLSGRPGSTSLAGTAAVADPATRTLDRFPAIETIKERFLEIRDRENRRVVTVIELLSPSNKGADRDLFLQRRLTLWRARVNFVEIDLLRGGRRTEDDVQEGDYVAMIHRASEPERLAIWSWTVRQPMPRLPIPLDPPDPDLTLDLRKVLDAIYDRAGYDHYLYATPPEPPLAEPDREWASGLLRRPSVDG